MVLSDFLGLFATTINFNSQAFKYCCESVVLVSVVLAILANLAEDSFLRISPRLKGALCSERLFLFFLCLGVVWGQFPVLCANYQLNHPDEPGIISQAFTLSRDPIFWHSIEGGTNGPLTSWPLTLLMLFGFQPEYSLARLGALFIVLISVVTLFKGTKLLYGPRIARIALLPFVVFFAFSRHPDFIQYSSHHASLALLSLAFYFGAKFFSSLLRGEQKPNLWSLFWTGLCLGGLPMAKLQYAYVSVYGMSVLLLLLVDFRKKGRLSIKATLMALLGYGVTPLVFIGSTFFVGAFSDFFTRYVLANRIYVASGYIPVLLSMLSLHTDYSIWAATSFREYFRPILAFFCGALIAHSLVAIFYPEKRHRVFLAIAFGLWIVAIYSACAPGRPFEHYALVVVVPTTLLLIATLGFVSTVRSALVRRCASLLTVAFLFFALRQDFGYFNGAFPSVYDTPPEGVRSQLSISAVSREILKYSSPGQRMAAWGYKPSFFVETGLLQGTKEYASYFQMRDSPYKRYFLRRYVEDMKRTDPEIFIDVVGEQTWDEFRDRSKHGHEFYNPVGRYVARCYELVADIEGVRIYRKRPNVKANRN